MRAALSLLVGLLIGVGAGLYIGLVQFPVEYTDAAMPRLLPAYRDEFTVMVAYGYLADDNLAAAIDRLLPLGAENVPQHIQETAERFISTSRGVNDVRALVALAEAAGRLTPIMEPFRPVDAAS